jgi:hypothetical protein
LGQTAQLRDLGYLMRAYQRYVSILEERLCEEVDEEQEDGHVAGALLTLCKQQILLFEDNSEDISLLDTLS